MQERVLRASDREKERPLRRSGSREKAYSPARRESREREFETDAEREAAARRRRLIEQTRLEEEKDSIGSAAKNIDWLNQVSLNDNATNEKRSNSNSDQIGVSKVSHNTRPPDIGPNHTA